jgi:hypothetical protein
VGGAGVSTIGPGRRYPARQTPPIWISSGTPVAVRGSGYSGTRRRAKPAGALRPGDAIRLESGKRVVITYVSVGFAPTDRYIEWRGAPTRNWANVSLNAQVIMGWYAHFRDPSPFGRIFPNRWGRRGMRNRLAPAGCCWDERPSI